MSLKKIVKQSFDRYDGDFDHYGSFSDELSDLIAKDVAEFLRPEIERLIVTMVPMEHIDSFLDDRINHILEE